MSTPVLSPPRVNPYVGPRPFERGQRLYGRDRQVAKLCDLLIAERIVLLYSPSGAGKTSLIQASLVPELEVAGFRVLPEIRVAVEPSAVDGELPRRNRYLISALLCLEQGMTPERQPDLNELCGMGLDEYLTQRYGESDGDVLIFDQFEELLIADLADQDSKSAFITELGVALRNRSRWALFAIREDYMAGLDPYLRPLPTRLCTRFRLDLLNEAAARDAVQRPAHDVGVEFPDAAAQRLVDGLRRVRVRRPEGPREVLGPYVEPVQLQVVCERLWEARSAAGVVRITQSDIENIRDVDSALVEYYAERVRAVASATGADERAIRNWFDRALITEEGLRIQTLTGPMKSRPENTPILRLLEDARLIRAATRGETKWFELAHDRLIEPVRASNTWWREANLEPFQRQASLWHSTSQPDHLLLTGDALAEADRWVEEHPNELGSRDRMFLAASRVHEEERNAQQRARLTRIRVALLFTATVMVFAMVALSVVFYQMRRALSELRAMEASLLLEGGSYGHSGRALEAAAWSPAPRTLRP
jgi:hypothetical protein